MPGRIVKRSPMPPRTAPMARTAFVSVPVVSSDPKPRRKRLGGRSAAKAASDAALAAVRPLLLERAAGLCEITGLPLDAHPHVHHRRKRGGPQFDVPSNLLVVNARSHLAAYDGSIHAEPAQSRHFGWIVRPGRDWRMVPVLVRGRWVLLTDDFEYVCLLSPTLTERRTSERRHRTTRPTEGASGKHHPLPLPDREGWRHPDRDTQLEPKMPSPRNHGGEPVTGKHAKPDDDRAAWSALPPGTIRYQHMPDKVLVPEEWLCDLLAEVRRLAAAERLNADPVATTADFAYAVGGPFSPEQVDLITGGEPVAAHDDPNREVLSVACDKCGAQPGALCVSNGQDSYGGHQERWEGLKRAIVAVGEPAAAPEEYPGLQRWFPVPPASEERSEWHDRNPKPGAAS